MKTLLKVVLITAVTQIACQVYAQKITQVYNLSDIPGDVPRIEVSHSNNSIYWMIDYFDWNYGNVMVLRGSFPWDPYTKSGRYPLQSWISCGYAYSFEFQWESANGGDTCQWAPFDAPTGDWYMLQDWSPDPSTVAAGVTFTQTQIWQQNWRKGERCIEGALLGQERNIQEYTKHRTETQNVVGTGTNFYSIEIVSGHGGTVSSGAKVDIKIKVYFYGNPAPNTPVTFTIHGGAGNFIVNGLPTSSPALVMTDASGIAMIQYQHIDEVGVEVSIIASSGNATKSIYTETTLPEPKNLSATVGYGWVSISWDRSPGNYQGFDIERTEQAWPYSYFMLDRNYPVSSYTDFTSDIAHDTELKYRVRAKSRSGGYSSWASVTVRTINW